VEHGDTYTNSLFLFAVFEFTECSVPIQEVTVPIKDGRVIEAMTEYVREHITAREASRRAAQSEEEKKKEKDAMRQQIKNELSKRPGMENVEITDDILSQVFDSNAVDAVPLLVNKKDTDFLSVNMYVDDQGIAKKLPVNSRATAFALSLEKRLQILGDAFIAMYYDNDNDFIRHDFTLADMNSDRPWQELARTMNRKQREAEEKGENEADKRMLQQMQLSAMRDQQREAAKSTAPQRVCGNGRTGCHEKASQRCGRCKSIWYCGRAHQQADWSIHKLECTSRD